MKEEKEWVLFKDIDWIDEKFNLFSVDTRDFHVGYNSSPDHNDIKTLSTYESKFFFSENELKDLIERLYNESGGKGEWRMLSLESTDERVLHWNLKYIRIWRSGKLFLVCNGLRTAIPKDILALPVNQEYLGHH